MHILITGANGFIGRNLRHTLECERPEHTLMLVDVNTPDAERRKAALQADFVFHFAGVNRPRNLDEFMTGNRDVTLDLMMELEAGKQPPVLLTSSIQAALNNPYGASKLAAEQAVEEYAARTGAPVYIYRLPNAFGKWSRPNYNSVVATFCHNIARNLPIQVNDPSAVIPLVYIDDIIREFGRALDGMPSRDESGACVVSPVFHIGVGELAARLGSFRDMRDQLEVPDQTDPLIRRLYATYLSFLPPEDFSRATVSHSDARGSFTELIHMGGYGQVSVNVIKPGITKGEHWHHTKHELFVVVSGEGVIRFRKPDDSTVIAYKVSGAVPQVVDIPPGYTHNIENIGDTDLVTLMWANERFNPSRPDTLPLAVAPKEDKA